MSNSPAKKLDFTPANKENVEVAVPIVGIPDLPEPGASKADHTPSVAATIKGEEAHEPLLQENPQRFVLFPIKYHEVGAIGVLTRLHASSRVALSGLSGKLIVGPDMANVQKSRGFLLDRRGD